MNKTIDVPGATLYHEVRGSGPVLLLICGGVYDAAGFAGLAENLADQYTVVTYDRRGNSRSHLEGPPEPQRIEVHADDAHRLLAEIGAGPAHVFGNSSGAIIGMELAIRHPDEVRTLVAHEPPLFDLLPDRDHWRSVIQDIEDTLAEKDPGAALEVLNAAFEAERGGADPDIEGRVPGGSEAPQELDPETMAMMARLEANMAFFITYEVPAFAKYTPDIAALKSSGVRIVPAFGEDSGPWEPPYRTALALADNLSAEPVAFPGDHGGFGQRPDLFAARLRQLLA